MSIEKMTGNVAVHQTLGDEPNGQDGMTADDLKKLFDEPGELLKAFINDYLVPYVLDKRGDSMTGNLLMNGYKVAGVGTPTEDGDAANKAYVDENSGKGALPTSGGTMTGAVRMNGIFLTPGKDFFDEEPSTVEENRLIFVKVVG